MEINNKVLQDDIGKLIKWSEKMADVITFWKHVYAYTQGMERNTGWTMKWEQLFYVQL